MSNTLLISVTHVFCSLNIKESKNKYTVHQFHGQQSQIRITKTKNLWFGPLKQYLSVHVMHFFKIISNTLLIFVTHFFLILNVKESKKNIMHQFHGQRPQIRRKNKIKNWFGPLKQCLSAYVMHFLKIMSNTLLISVTHFFFVV